MKSNFIIISVVMIYQVSVAEQSPRLPDAQEGEAGRSAHAPQCAEQGVEPVRWGVCWCCFMTQTIAVTCSGSNVTHVPLALPENMTDLEFVETRIGTLEGDNNTSEFPGVSVSSFYPYLHLKHLSFKMNAHLQSVGEGAFMFPPGGNTVLSLLSITDSPHLTHLPRGALGNFHSLRILQIVRCGLTRPPDWQLFFPGVNIVLENIDLGGNKITELDEKSFLNLTYEVGQISLENNSIHHIADNTLAGMKIHTLTLRENKKLTVIEEQAFRGVLELEKLDLSGTHITQLPTAGLGMLKHLLLENVYTLKVFPSVLELLELRVAQLTYPQHCCAFAHPEQQDKQAWRDFLDKFERQCPATPSPQHLPPVTLIGNINTESPRLGSLRDRRWSSTSPIENLFDDSNVNTPHIPYTFTTTRPGPYLNQDAESDLFVLGSVHTPIDPNKAYNKTFNCGKGYVVEKKWIIKCSPPPDAFNPCEDLMGWLALRVVVWCVLTCALFGNLIVLLVIFCSRHKLTVQNFLMCNLAFSDLLLGVYLLLLAATDAATIGRYFTIAIPWQYKGGCQVAGFLAIFATNLSILTLTVITLERWYAIRHAINLSKRLKLRQTCLALLAVWVYAVLMATLPLLDVSSYSMTSICLPMRAERVLDQLYLVFMLLANASAFIVISYCYIDMYRQVRGNESAAGRNDANIAKKMALLVFTDFICLFPITLFGLTAAVGKPLITVSYSKILLVFFFPLNSCCNPFLYAIFTQQFRKDLFGVLSRFGVCEKRAARYRYTFSSNQLSTNSKNSLQSLKARKGASKRGGKAHSPTHYMPVNNSGADMTTDTTLSKARMSVPAIVLEGEVGNGAVPGSDCAETGFNGAEEVCSSTTNETEVDSKEGNGSTCH